MGIKVEPTIDTGIVILDDPSNAQGIKAKRDEYADKLGKLMSNLSFLEQHNPAGLADLAARITRDSGIDLEEDLDLPAEIDPKVAAPAPETSKAKEASPTLQILQAFRANIKTVEKEAKKILIVDISYDNSLFAEVEKATKATASEKFGRNTELVQHSLRGLSEERGAHLDALLDPKALRAPTKATKTVLSTLEAKGLQTLKSDMRPFAAALGSRYAYKKYGGMLIPVKLTAEYKQDPEYQKATVFIINGNNDLKQVEQACKEFLAHPNRENMHMYISGFGGHGTMRGPIFAKTEAETMGRLAINLGIPADKLHLETDATNSGENVGFLNRMIKSKQPEAQHFVMSGTNAAVFRQVLTLAGQSTELDIKSISTVPTDRPIEDYMSDMEDGKVYALCYMRELATQVVYAMKTKYLAACDHVEKEDLKKSLRLCIKYYEELAKPEKTLTEAEIKTVIENYIKFTGEKVMVGSSKGSYVIEQSDVETFKSQPEYKAVTDVFEPINAFFRDTFAEVERISMPRLSPTLTDAEQTKALVAHAASLGVRAQMTQ